MSTVLVCGFRPNRLVPQGPNVYRTQLVEKTLRSNITKYLAINIRRTIVLERQRREMQQPGATPQELESTDTGSAEGA